MLTAHAFHRTLQQKKNDSFQMHSSRIAIMCHIIQMCNDLKFERLTKRSCVS